MGSRGHYVVNDVVSTHTFADADRLKRQASPRYSTTIAAPFYGNHCTICLQDAAEHAVQLWCGHIYHLDCIETGSNLRSHAPCDVSALIRFEKFAMLTCSAGT